MRFVMRSLRTSFSYVVFMLFFFCLHVFFHACFVFRAFLKNAFDAHRDLSRPFFCKLIIVNKYPNMFGF